METKKLSGKAEPPCSQCPYKLGLVETVVNPCPQCMLDGCRAYEWFMRQPFEKYVRYKNEGSL